MAGTLLVACLEVMLVFSWAGVGEGLKAVRAPGVATLVLLDRCSTHFPPFLRGRGALGEIVLLFEPPPVRGLDTFVSLSHVFFPPFAP